MSEKWKMTWLCIVVLFLGGTVALAQTITGSVRGTVTDPSGAVVPGATVTIINTGTGVIGHTVSDKSGLYNFEFLVIGEYTVTATANGFDTASIGPFRIQIDQIATANAQLQVGTTSTTVSVSGASSELLNTENSTVSTSISATALENMPMDGQNVQIATLYVPGSINPNSSLMGGQQGTERDAYTTSNGGPSDVQASFNGNRQQSNSYILDGVDINETLQNGIGYNPSPYSIQEVHVITGNADAEFGNVNGGEVVMVTKGGTNEFHGSGFVFHEASGLTANTYSNKDRPIITPRSNYNQNQFGGAVGGPIFKNKLFFFANYIGMHFNQPPSVALGSVPTSAERGLSTAAPGGFDTASSCPAGLADLSGISPPSIDATVLYNTSGGTNNETPYPGNCIPIINPVAKFLIAHPDLYPLPNNPSSPGSVTGGNYRGMAASTTHNDQGDGRLDYTINSKDTLMVKYSLGDAWDAPSEAPIPAVIAIGDDYPFTSSVIAWTRIISPTIVNNARAGFTRISLNASIPYDLSGAFGATGNSKVGVGLPTGWTQPIAGFAYMVLGADINNIGSQPPIQGTALDNNFDYNDSLTWERGKQIFKFGADLLRYQQDYFSTSDLGGVLGQFMYSGAFTADTNPNVIDANGYPYADFLLDQANTAQIAGIRGYFGQRQWRDAVFAQDDWKIRPNLTLNLGLRYSYEQPNYEVNNKMVNVNLPEALHAPVGTPINSMLEFAGQYNPITGKTNSRALINPYRLGFMPRVGFAYTVNPRLVVRGGYGSTDELESTGSSLRMTQNVQVQPSVNQTGQIPTATSGGISYTAANGLVAGTSTASGIGALYYAWDPNMRPAVIQQFSLNVQYQIDNHTSVQAGYVGQTGQHLAVPLWINQYTEDQPANCDAACFQAIEPYYALVGNASTNGSAIIKETASRAISNYHSLQATLNHHQSHGVEFLVNYTFAKSMTNNEGYFGVDGNGDADSYYQDVNNPRGDYGPSNFDARQTVSGTAVYKLPFGHGQQFGANWNRVVDEVAGGWQLSGNLQLNTGYPLTPHTSAVCNDNCAQLQDYFAHLNQYGPLKVAGRGTNAAGVFKWFGTDPSAAPCNARSTSPSAANPACAFGRTNTDFGTSKIGTLRGPGFQNYDLSLSKGFRTIKEQTLKARVDAFNAFNISSYGQPNMYVGGNDNSFGAITSTSSGPRKIQLSMVYEF